MFESLQVWFGAFYSFPFVHLSLYIYQNVLATSTLQAWYSRTTRLAQIPQLVLPVLGFCSYHMNILTSALAVGFKSPVRILPWVNCDLWISMGEWGVGGDDIFTRLNTPSMNMVYYGQSNWSTRVSCSSLFSSPQEGVECIIGFLLSRYCGELIHECEDFR